MSDFPHTPPRYSATFTPAINAEIRRAAASGIYDIRGGGTKRHLPHFDDLLFLGASISRYPLEGYREKCGTDVVLGTRFAKKPIELKIPITIAGMSFGSLSASTFCSVASDTFLCVVMDRPRKTSPSFSP